MRPSSVKDNPGLPGGGASGILTLGWKPAIVMGCKVGAASVW